MIQPMPPATAIETRIVVRTDKARPACSRLEQIHRRSQQKCQSERKREGDQNLAREVQGRDRSEQDDGCPCRSASWFGGQARSDVSE